MPAGTLHLWDFDDTLAASSSAVAALRSQHPKVPWSAWWHDPAWSSLAARSTQPHAHLLARLGAMEGTHWILTGRVLDAIQAWFAVQAGGPWDSVLRRISRVVSVSGYTKEQGDTAAARKAAFVERECAAWPAIVVYDDSTDCLKAIKAVRPDAVTHRAAGGYLVNSTDANLRFSGAPT